MKNRIKEIVAERGIKQSWIAKKIGKSNNIVSAYLSNRIQPPLPVIVEIAKVLNVKVDELISNDE